MKKDIQLQPDLPFGHFAPTGIRAVMLRLCHRLPATMPGGRSLNKLLRSPLKHGQLRQFDVTYKGLKLRLRTRGNYCELRQLFAPQYYDVEEIDWLCAELAEGGCFVDIGGNIGLYSLHVGHRCGPRSRIIAVEPEPGLTERMQFNARNNGIQIELAVRALSDYSGVGTLHSGGHQSGENTLIPGANGVTVPVTTLLELCDELGIKDIRALKIDIEGHEERVLASFFDQAPRSLWPQAIVIEHTTHANRIIQRLERDLGYTQVGRTRRNMLLRLGKQ
ncbi:FkbM family methyltransferase [Thioalkalivibrio sp.]|uniref:FkbM family methyltransferase n=1 Tax=Thioalkalivibrio sp. TaxID=2093813 RepID=UPI00356B4B42